MFDGQIYLDELFGDHDVAAKIPEKSSPPYKKVAWIQLTLLLCLVDARSFSYGKLSAHLNFMIVDSFLV